MAAALAVYSKDVLFVWYPLLAEEIRALELAEQAVFGDPQANATLMAGSGGRRAVACHQLLQAMQRFEQNWQAVP